MTDARLVFTALPDAGAAAALARTLVEERLAACGNVVPGVRSIYRWQGKVHDEGEVLLLLKTRAAQVERLQARILELHPYQVPEVISVAIDAGSPGYLAWLAAETGPSPGPGSVTS
ncbi:MAG: divalent-cation tolerance protein CutA [Myxococcales bacterium]